MADTYWERFWRRPLTRRRALRGAALGGAGLAAAAIIGCGEEEEAKPAATPARPAATPGAATPAPAAAVKPVRGGTIFGNEQADPGTLDPYKKVDYIVYDFASAWYNRLWTYMEEKQGGVKGDDYNKLIAVPDLAASVEVSADLLTYTYKLRPGVKWQNLPPLNGRPFTSEDVKLSADKFMDAKRNVQSQLFLGDVEAVTTPDPLTVVFKLKGPNAWWTNVLAHQNVFYITPAKEEVAGAIDILKTPAGTGPFIFEKWDEGISISMRRNPDFFRKSIYDGQPIPYVDKVVTILKRDPAAKAADFRAGKMDIIDYRNMSRSIMEDIAKATGGQLDIYGNIGMNGVSFQSAFPDFQTRTAQPVKPYDPGSPFNDERVRKAVSLALNRDALLKVQEGEGIGKWHNFVTAGMPNYWLDPVGKEMEAAGVAKWFKYNLAEAKQLMAAAGYGAGIPEQTYHGSNVVHLGGSGKASWEAIASMVSQIGIKTQSVLDDHPTVWITRTWRGDQKGFGIWSTGGKGVVYEFLRDSFSKDGYGHHGILDPQMDDFILNRLKRAAKEEERVQITKEFQFYMAGKMYMVPEVDPRLYNLAQKWVKNWHDQTWFDDHGETYPFSWIDGRPT